MVRSGPKHPYLLAFAQRSTVRQRSHRGNFHLPARSLSRKRFLFLVRATGRAAGSSQMALTFAGRLSRLGPQSRSCKGRGPARGSAGPFPFRSGQKRELERAGLSRRIWDDLTARGRLRIIPELSRGRADRSPAGDVGRHGSSPPPTSSITCFPFKSTCRMPLPNDRPGHSRSTDFRQPITQNDNAHEQARDDALYPWPGLLSTARVPTRMSCAFQIIQIIHIFQIIPIIPIVHIVRAVRIRIPTLRLRG